MSRRSEFAFRRIGLVAGIALLLCAASAFALVTTAMAADLTGSAPTTGTTVPVLTPVPTLAVTPVAKVGKSFTLRVTIGSLDPSSTPSAKIVAQRWSREKLKWVPAKSSALNLGRVGTAPTASSSIARTFKSHGPYRFKVVCRRDSSSPWIASEWQEVTVCGRKVIALTLDDGPDVRDTPIALAALDRYQARATFFMLGNRVKKRPSLVRRMALSGHQLGNHSWRHLPATKMSTAKFRASVANTNREIERALRADPKAVAAHRYPVAFRYPWGAGNDRTEGVIRTLGMRSHLWTYATGDGGTHGPRRAQVIDLIARKVIDNARPGGVILMHDGQDRPNSVAALPKILRTLTARGYDFVTIEDLRLLKKL